MSSRGTLESDILKQNVQEQIERLSRQLADIEEMKDDLDDEEYKEMRVETEQQLKEAQILLIKSQKGDMSLVNESNANQLNIQAAISNAFKTPEVIDLFTKKQPGQLRNRLAIIERDFKIGKMGIDIYKQEKVEILGAIKKLNGKLTTSELSYLSQNGSSSLSSFLKVENQSITADNILSVAEAEIRNTKS